jgi:3-dehydroquinate synthase
MKTLTVNLGERSYPILIGSGLLCAPGVLDAHVADRDLLIVTNDVVGPLYLDRLKKTLASPNIGAVILPDGEAHKSMATLQSILDELVARRYSRDCVLLTLGGGVVGDIGGFAAAAYQRGVEFIQVPTTLLAQVDSAVGGKTGVNHPGGKNLIGAFHQPQVVLVDTDSLQTLPERELSAGLAEVVKYGLIADAELFSWLEANADDLLSGDQETLTEVIYRCCQIKAQIVADDEREHGRRALLNFGHTFGHAIEHCAGYGEWLHGEAVAAGMMMAVSFSAELGNIAEPDIERIADLLRKFRLPIAPPSLDPDAFLAAMAMDKKVIGGEIRLVLLQSIGDAEVTANYPTGQMHDLVRRQLSR